MQCTQVSLWVQLSKSLLLNQRPKIISCDRGKLNGKILKTWNWTDLEAHKESWLCLQETRRCLFWFCSLVFAKEEEVTLIIPEIKYVWDICELWIEFWCRAYRFYKAVIWGLCERENYPSGIGCVLDIIAKEEDKTNSFQVKFILLLGYSIYAGGWWRIRGAKGWPEGIDCAFTSIQKK